MPTSLSAGRAVGGGPTMSGLGRAGASGLIDVEPRGPVGVAGSGVRMLGCRSPRSGAKFGPVLGHGGSVRITDEPRGGCDGDVRLAM